MNIRQILFLYRIYYSLQMCIKVIKLLFSTLYDTRKEDDIFEKNYKKDNRIKLDHDCLDNHWHWYCLCHFWSQQYPNMGSYASIFNDVYENAYWN